MSHIRPHRIIIEDTRFRLQKKTGGEPRRDAEAAEHEAVRKGKVRAIAFFRFGYKIPELITVGSLPGTKRISILTLAEIVEQGVDLIIVERKGGGNRFCNRKEQRLCAGIYGRIKTQGFRRKPLSRISRRRLRRNKVERHAV